MNKYEIPPPDLIRRFLNDTCTDQEKNEVLQWYAAWEQEEDPLQQLPAADLQALRQKMLSGIQLRIQQLSMPVTIPVTPKPVFKWVRYAAASAAAVALLIVGISKYSAHYSPAPTMVVHEILQNNSSTIRTFKLDDGSIVWLKPGATLIAAEEFGSKNRNLRLTGEAYFDVATNTKLPFRVSNRFLTTEVLGTSFSMKETASNAEVTVFSGKVAVRRLQQNAAATTVLPHQKASIPAASQPIQLVNIDATTPDIWERCELNFNNSTIDEISKALNKRFQVNIIIQDSTIARYTLKADFSGMHLPAILDMMHKAVNINYSINGQEIILQQPSSQH
ncbi:MAG: FecR family protein [Chitinophaga sp.]|uniref:FecR family protein n=1 Tax=Chitinophaga sp. TaxID=1869181 RepID=UPI0025C2AFE4|nr:FecR domain-containing protein [Chitinophaga sp.]MBV8250976.1 FecR family protein [Chitinophaga sp.]